MINNFRRTWRPTRGASLALLWLCACSSASAGPARELQGVVELDTVTLAFEVGGRVEQVAVDEGAHLEGRALLAKLDESMAKPEREARAAELEAAKAQLALLEAGARSDELRAVEAEIHSVAEQESVLERQRERQLKLFAEGASPSARMDELDAQASALSGLREVLTQKLRGLRTGARKQELDAARAKVESLAAALLAMDARLLRYTLWHEGSADVLDVFVKVGEVVAPGAPAVRVADLDHPYVDVFVPQGDLAGIRIGAPMSVRIDAVSHALAGRIERVGYKTEFTPRYLFSEDERVNLVVRVRVRVDDPQHELHAGVPAFVSRGLEREK